MAVLKDLIVHGSSRFLNGASFNTINAESIGASQGIFNKLIATTLDVKEATIDNLTAQNATVVGLLDVQGELHTNSWTNANIANIGGSFYISPTVEPTDGTTTISITRNSATSWTVSAAGTFATDFVKSGTATSGVTWPANSLVLITGDVVVGDMVYPLGTLKGTLSAQVTATAASTSKTITITGVTDAQNNTSPSVLQTLYELNNNANISNAAFKNGKISLYKLGSNPIGILLSSMGTSSNSIIDIYGGVSTNPNVRIGHLAGLPNVNGSAPTGWGIYTDNGYFSGVIVSTSGKIANFTINGSKMYSNGKTSYSAAATNGGIYIGDDYISFGDGTKTYFYKDGTGKIGPWTLSTTYFRNGNIANATNTSVSGVYLGTDGLNISNGTAATTSYITKSAVNIGNKLTWNGSVLKVDGEITASKLTISSGATIGGDGANQILNSEIEIGGKNLLVGTAISITKTTTATSSYVTQSLYYTPSKVTLEELGLQTGDKVTLSFDWKITSASTYGNARIEYYGTTSSNADAYIAALVNPFATFSSTNTSGHFVTTVTLTDATIKTKRLLLRIDNSNLTLTISNLKFEKGNKATDWTPAPEDIDVNKYITYISANDGIKVHNASDETNYLQLNSTAIKFVKSGTEKITIHSDGYVMVGNNSGTNGNLYIDSSGIQLRRGTSSYVTLANDSTNGYFVRIGMGTSGHAMIKNDGLQIWCGSSGSTLTANLGYGPGKNMAGNQTNAPFYTFGKRHSDTVGNWSVAEGYETIASNFASYSEGHYTISSGLASHAEGDTTSASGTASHSQNQGTIAQGYCQTAIGNYNIAQGDVDSRSKTDLAFIIGNGVSDSARSNALTVNWNGDVKARAFYDGTVSNNSLILALGTYISAGLLTNAGRELVFSIPTGRVFPNGTTVYSISFDIVVRIASTDPSASSGSGAYYIVKKTSGGTDTTSFNSTINSSFYDGSNTSRTLASGNWTKTLQGGTNILIDLYNSTSNFFTGNATVLNRVNNMPCAVYLLNISAVLDLPTT